MYLNYHLQLMVLVIGHTLIARRISPSMYGGVQMAAADLWPQSQLRKKTSARGAIADSWFGGSSSQPHTTLLTGRQQR